MFLTNWVRGAQKTVRFKAEGGDTARFLRRLRQAEVELWQLRGFDGGFFAWCDASDYKRLPPIVRGTGMRVHIVKKRGLPFRLARYRGRWGIPAGLAVAAALFLVLCPRIWVIEVQSDDVNRPMTPALTAAVQTYLEENGVVIGMKTASLQPEKIRLNAAARLAGVHALSVNVSGCVAVVSVIPLHSDAKPPDSTTVLSNLVAKKDGVIVRCEIASGNRICQIGEAVTKGTLLATGVVDTEKGPLLHRATGRVLAETEHRITVTVPYCETVTQPAGKRLSRYTLSAFGLSAPFYAPLDTSGWQTQKETRSLRLFGRAMPLSVTKETQIEPVTVTVHRTRAEASAAAKAAATQRLAAAKAEQILSKTEHVTTDEDGVTVTLDVTMIEDIALEVPVTMRE